MPIIPADQSPYEWVNEHRTVGTTLDKYFTAYNPTSPLNRGLSAMEILRTAARELEQLLKDARSAKKHFRAQGAGWALNDLAMTMPKGWMLWTTNLNGHWDVSPVHRHPKYSATKLKNLVLCQGGATVGKLNEYLENRTANRRAFQTSGIGNGQSIAGAISGSTHGSAVRFGATPDYVVGLQLVTGRGKSLWLERASYPVMNDRFIADLKADLVRDDDVFAAAQVSLGAFGIIASLAFEANEIYHLAFPTAREINQEQLGQELETLADVSNEDDSKWYHYEFIFNPYRLKPILVAAAKKVPYSGHIPPPRGAPWELDSACLTPSDNLPAWVLRLPIPTANHRLSVEVVPAKRSSGELDGHTRPGFLSHFDIFQGYRGNSVRSFYRWCHQSHGHQHRYCERSSSSRVCVKPVWFIRPSPCWALHSIVRRRLFSSSPWPKEKGTRSLKTNCEEGSPMPVSPIPFTGQRTLA